MSESDPRGPVRGRRARFRQLVHQLRTERGGSRRDAVAVGLGVFIGCTPLYGLHLAMSVLAADLFRLNRLKVYLAANISNPLLLPFIAFAEVQTGAWLRSGRFHPLTLEALRAVDPWIFGLDLVVGAAAVGAGLGVVAGLLTWAAAHDRHADPAFRRLVDRAAARYAVLSLTAWEFASAKLRSDFVYRRALDPDVLPGGELVLDIGCGQGLMLALLLGAADAAGEPGERPWPRYARVAGIEPRPRIARLAVGALASDRVQIVTARANETPLPAADAVLLFDVLQMMPRGEQVQLLRRVRAAIRPGGVVLVREADASAGWRFWGVRFGNRLKALGSGHLRQTLDFRSREEWRACFEAAGFDSAILAPPSPPFLGNVLFRLTANDNLVGRRGD